MMLNKTGYGKALLWVLIAMVVVSAHQTPVNAPTTSYTTVQTQELVPEPEPTPAAEISRSEPEGHLFEITAYDLSVASCGKAPDHPAYGITASGVDIGGKEFPSTRVIAVDTNVIPMGSHVSIQFVEDNYSKYNGIYTAVDTGSAIIGNRIDIFLGTDSYDECMTFGRTEAFVEIIK